MYMVGAHPSWPDKCVWVDPGHPDHVWEFIPIRLRVWASSIVRTNNHSTQLVANIRCDIQATGETDYTRPPTSNHFNDDKRLCEPQCPAPPADIQPATQPLPRTAVPPMWPQQQYMWPPYQQFPPPYTFPPQAYLHQQLPQQPGHGPYPPNQYAHAAPILAGPPSTHSSLGLVAHHNISLVNFCSCYKISNIDQRKLVELEYEPSEKLIKSLDEKDWKGVGFSMMGWKHFIVAHQQFRKDLKTGVFDPTISWFCSHNLSNLLQLLLSLSCYLVAFGIHYKCHVAKFVSCSNRSLVFTECNQHVWTTPQTSLQWCSYRLPIVILWDWQSGGGCDHAFWWRPWLYAIITITNLRWCNVRLMSTERFFNWVQIWRISGKVENETT